MRRGFIVILVSALLAAPPLVRAQPGPPARAAVHHLAVREWASWRFANILEHIEQSNLPKLVDSARWESLLRQYRPIIERAPTHRAFAKALNALFEASGSSHFAYFMQDDFCYWHLRSAFEGDKPETRVAHVGLFAQRIDGRWFVRGVFEGSAAGGGKIRVGDELLTVDGLPFEPIASFRGKAGESTVVKLRRKPGLTYSVKLTPVKESLHQALLRAVSKSIKIIEYDGRRLAYLHGWILLGPGDEYRRLLKLQPIVDGLLLDYREGFGGTWGVAQRFLIGKREDESSPFLAPRWTKPAVLLIGDGTRSAKEIIAARAQKTGRATLVGTATPGHVTSVGGLVRIGSDGLLLLPGHRFSLEGKPTQPDILVGREIPYCAGADPQLERAKEELIRLINERPQMEPEIASE
jgi:carboxyl-terminal processing protease